MISPPRYLMISIISLLFLLFGFYYVFVSLENESSNSIKFNDQNLSLSFEIDISQNINKINDYLNNYKFIENYIIKKKNSKIFINIVLKKPFAKNNLNQEIIFKDNSIASYDFFSQSFIDNIYLIDTSVESLKINKYLNTTFKDLKRIFNITHIEFIDQRRYNLILQNNIKVMLPKKIDKELIFFIEENLEFLKNNNDFREYLDFRNFNKKMIRVK
ncbi:MAG: hypothetical protein ACJ0RM_03240 [Alphaproteobacteria bacterium]|tara:strand:+ start:83 stop:730 length:648 start_codon:yes stop_codon:yes gene_type:complete